LSEAEQHVGDRVRVAEQRAPTRRLRTALRAEHLETPLFVGVRQELVE
jgi:hypothetical protein